MADIVQPQALTITEVRIGQGITNAFQPHLLVVENKKDDGPNTVTIGFSKFGVAVLAEISLGDAMQIAAKLAEIAAIKEVIIE